MADLGMCKNRYRMMIHGPYACLNHEAKIGAQIVFFDKMVMIGSGTRRQGKPDYENNNFVRPPNFIIEVGDHKSKPLKEKKQLSALSYAQEYPVIYKQLVKVEWKRLNRAAFKLIKPDRDGLINSTSLPGLWISITAQKKGSLGHQGIYR